MKPELLKLTRSFNVPLKHETELNKKIPRLSSVDTPLEQMFALKEAMRQENKNITIAITINYLLILYCTLKDSSTNESLDANEQLYNLLNCLYLGEQYVLTVRATGIRDIINIIVELDKNEELRTFFQGVLNFNENDEENWDKIALKVDIDSAENKTWLMIKINDIKKQAEDIYDGGNDYSSFIHFIVGCKVYMHRMRMETPMLPVKKDNLTEDIINDSFLNLIRTNGILLNKNTGNRSNKGREIITYFMENEQIKTSKAGCSYYTALTSPAIVCFILRQLNTRVVLKSFLNKLYENLVPYTSFRPLFLKSLIETLRSQGADITSIFDPTGGWGGTILGAAISNVEQVYDCDPNMALAAPKTEMVSLLTREAQKNSFNTNFTCTLIKKPVENIIQADFGTLTKQVDMICFSPPFFNYEKYDACDEHNQTQSRRKYSGYQGWMKGFVPLLIENSACFLKEKGIFAVQVSNTAQYKSLAEDFLKVIDKSNIFTQERQEFIYSQYCGGNGPQGQQNYFYVFRKKNRLYSAVLDHQTQDISPHNADNLSEIPPSDSTNNERKEGQVSQTFFGVGTLIAAATALESADSEVKESNKGKRSSLGEQPAMFFSRYNGSACVNPTSNKKLKTPFLMN